MYGPPGTGKTMMAKAVANATTASFINVVGSEFVQKYLGEGPRMVRDVFRLARENSPAIIFIDEIDAIATKRFDAQTGADREVQRILLELLNQMDGFDQTTNVKVIMATNRADTLDPALLRPGRLDRKIEFPNPDRRQKRLVFSACTSKMNLSDEVSEQDLSFVYLFFSSMSRLIWKIGSTDLIKSLPQTLQQFVKKLACKLSVTIVTSFCPRISTKPIVSS
jgi:26S proteasome regulatory subunit T3